MLKVLREVLTSHPEVLFAYVYGSFTEALPFHDIDVGVYNASEDPRENLWKALELAAELERAIRSWACEFGTSDTPHSIPVDVRVLNRAPASFCYHVLQGRLLCSRDEGVRVQWAERVLWEYLDLKPLRSRALKEAITSWS